MIEWLQSVGGVAEWTRRGPRALFVVSLFCQSISERGLTGAVRGMLDRRGYGDMGADTNLDMDMDVDTYPDAGRSPLFK